MRILRTAWALAGMVTCVVGGTMALTGCDDLPGERIVIGPPDEVFIPGLNGVGVGGDCSETACRPGLVCSDGQVCEVAGTQTAGQTCVIGAECADGLQCYPGACPVTGVAICPVCTAAGDAAEGESCQGDLDCASGLRCLPNGFSAECTPAGTVDLGGECSAQNDCFQGLYCNGGECSLEPPLFEGVGCSAPDDSNVEALFVVPGAGSSPSGVDYFQLPFPNDFRMAADGSIDLGAFPTPGPGLLGVDFVEKYIEAIENHARGWSANPTVIFRFSGAVDLSTFSGTDARLYAVDLDNQPTISDPTKAGMRTLATSFATGPRTNYVCDDWFALRLPVDTLVPGHRYAVFMTTAVKSAQGKSIARSEQFSLMLGNTEPGDSALAKAWNAYAPLRDFVTKYQGTNLEIDADEILAGTVFTVGDVQQPMRSLAAAVESAAAPTASSWVKCGGSAKSPCAQADEAEGRACGSGTSDYDEYQALLEIPIFQKGEAPYLSTGGSIASAPTRTEKVCMSMSIPKGTAPAAGWPLVVFGHGTGGSYRSSLRQEVAGRLATEAAPMATLGFDEVQHGPRRGSGEGSDEDPDNLFFNFVNPDAARGNPLQGATDFLSVLRFAATGALASASDTGADAISVDPTKIVLFGHSQGSTHASMALPFTTLSGGVFSGNGGGLAEALMAKTNPVNIAGALPFVIQDADDQGNLRMGESHPVLALLQHYIDPADPVNFAALLADRPEASAGVKQVLQTFGLDDTYAPPKTLARFIYAAPSMTLAPAPAGLSPKGDNKLVITAAGAPVSGNVSDNMVDYTLVCRQYAPAANSDGHFVVFDNQDANDDVIAFLSALNGGVTPTVPAP